MTDRSGQATGESDRLGPAEDEDAGSPEADRSLEPGPDVGRTTAPADPSAPHAPEDGTAPTGDRSPPAAAASPRRRWAVWATLVVIVLAAAGGGWWYWAGSRGAPAGGAQAGRSGQSGGGSGPARVPVDVATVEVADVPVYYDSLGTVQAFNTVLVRSRVDGEIVEIAFQEGQTVRAGDLIARVDPRPYQAALDQAVARKAQDEATLASTTLDLQRTRKLADQAFASRQQLDQQTATQASQTAQIASDQAAIDSARTQLDYATIRAPISGRTGLRLADKGNIVHSGDQTGIVEIAQLQPISVLFTAPEGQLPDIKAAKAAGDVKVQALATDGKTVLGEGVLALINNTVDPASGSVRLKATFPNPDDRLWPGLSVNTRLLARTVQGALVIPDTALMRAQKELFVFTVGQDGKAERRTVRIGVFSGGKVVVEDGLNQGERVVVAGQSRLQPGSQVQVDAGAARSPANAADSGSQTSAGRP